MAERWKWSAFCVYGFFVSTIVYPDLRQLGLGRRLALAARQRWPGPRLHRLRGSGVVHAVGGWWALAGAIVLGPRLGKYNKDGSANTIPGHNLIFALLGTFILAFGWFGFNPGSTLGASAQWQPAHRLDRGGYDAGGRLCFGSRDDLYLVTARRSPISG